MRWPGALKGRHRQVANAYEPNAGFPLAFAYTRHVIFLENFFDELRWKVLSPMIDGA